MNKEELSSKHAFFALVAFISIMAIVCVFGGCKCPQIVTNEVVKEIKVVERDSIISFKPDSASVYALLECDSNNQVILKKLETIMGERITPTVTISHIDNAAAMVFECKEDSLKKEIQFRDSIISTMQTKTVVVEKNVRSGWDKFWAVAGPLTWLLILLWIAFKIYFRR